MADYVEDLTAGDSENRFMQHACGSNTVESTTCAHNAHV